MAEPAIQIEKLVKQFNNTPVLDTVTFSVESGEILAYLGPNGAGKTTTMRILLGLLPADSGLVRMLGRNVDTEFDRVGPRLGAVLDSHCLHPLLTITETLGFYADLYKLDERKKREQIAWLLDCFGLQEIARKQVKVLSKGMRQRLAFARALVHEPELLLLDEPFDGIDTETQRELRQSIRYLARERGVTIFLTTHDLHEVEQVADRVTILKQGCIVVSDTTEKLKGILSRNVIRVRFTDPVDIILLERALGRSYANRELQLTEAGHLLTLELHNGDNGTTLLAQLVTSGIPVAEFAPLTTSLEEAYFDLLRHGPVWRL
jgi:ABC-2 type transport system ATP-binding protein